MVQKPANAIIDVQSVYSIGYSNATGSYTNVLSLSHTGEVGDIVLIDWHAAFTTVGSGGSYSRISITDGGVETDIAATRATHSAVREHHGGAYKHTVGSAGAIVVRLKAVSISSGTTADDAGGAVTCVPSMKSVLIRP